MKEQHISDIVHSYEKIPAEICRDSFEGSHRIADIIIGKIKSAKGVCRIGLCTGSTPVTLYKELTERCRAGEVSFANVEVFSIDEYYPRPENSLQIRNARLYEDLLNNVDIKPENIHTPNGSIESSELSAYCARFDAMARGLDLLVTGVGEQGQVGFNEAGSSPRSRTRAVLLSHKSRKRQARNFNGDLSVTPESAITIGISTILSAKQIVLMAWGEGKAQTVKDIVEGEPDTHCPASLLQVHDNISFYTDTDSASLLTRCTAPWLVSTCDWSDKMVRKAVIWLCEQAGKPILKLTQQDYLDNSLGDLLEEKGPYDKINIDVFNDLQHTITGWPGGKPNADDTYRPVSSAPFPKRVIIFSPHPDDDVISMGGTFIRLVQQGHDVHVAYETSGNVAVHDDVVVQHIDAARELGYGDRCEELQRILAAKVPGAPEPRELLNLKGAIRRSEARGAVRSFGLNPDTNAHFLNLPFYESGGIKKNPRTQADIDIVKDLLQRIKPHQIYVAGDLADPHGTHRVCTETVFDAVEQLRGEEWLNDCHCWLYRGAWMEWELDKVDMAVPLSPDELIMKRHAIYRHLSQKDIMPFPGDDPREFWQRAEERTQNTARLYDALGMAEYQAIEVFVKHF